LCVRAGDALVLGEEDEENEGWVWATDPEDRGGWAPIDLADPQTGLARYDYSAAELNAAEGELVTVEEDRNGWAWCVNEAGEKGWIPLPNLEPAR
jgi:hypothetical protein